MFLPNVKFKVRKDYRRLTLSEDSDINVGSLDDLNVSIDGVDIPLFLNSLDIFAESVIYRCSQGQSEALVNNTCKQKQN